MSLTHARAGAAVVTATAALALLTGCSSEPSCGDGYDSAEASISALLAAARSDEPNLACASLPKNSTTEQVAAEVDAYKEFAAKSETISVQEVDQMGRGYTFDVTVGDETRTVEVFSEIRGRWFWKKDVYIVGPQTYTIDEGADPTPSTTVDQ